MEPLVETKLIVTSVSVLRVTKGMIVKRISMTVQATLVKMEANVLTESPVIIAFAL